MTFWGFGRADNWCFNKRYRVVGGGGLFENNWYYAQQIHRTGCAGLFSLLAMNVSGRVRTAVRGAAWPARAGLWHLVRV